MQNSRGWKGATWGRRRTSLGDRRRAVTCTRCLFHICHTRSWGTTPKIRSSLLLLLVSHPPPSRVHNALSAKKILQIKIFWFCGTWTCLQRRVFLLDPRCHSGTLPYLCKAHWELSSKSHIELKFFFAPLCVALVAYVCRECWERSLKGHV